MLWKIAIHAGLLHPDFVRDKLSEKQLYEIAWYFEQSPFGYEIDHLMLARICCSMAGGDEEKWMPSIEHEVSKNQFLSSLPGAMEFITEQGIVLDDERN
jgi:hypothetical protein